MCRHPARAGEGTNFNFRYGDRSLPPRLQPDASPAASPTESAAAPGAVQPRVALSASAPARISASVVRASGAMRGTLAPFSPFHAFPGLTANCFLFAQPTITPAEAGIDTSLTQTDEERALCLYVRALTDERVPATRCFSTLSPFPPPPPPTPQSTLAAIQTALRRAKLRRGGTSGADPTPPRTDEEEYIQQHIDQNQAVNALLDRLSAENFQLRDALNEIRPKLSDTTATSGRRLFERLAGTGTHSLEQSIKASELSVGNGALLGLTVAQCSTLCTALKNKTDALHSCNAVLFRMLEPDNAANLQTAYCYLLKSMGGCQPMDFAASIFSRRDTSGCRTPNSRDNPACVQLAPDRADMRILDFAAAKASCRQGKGAPRLPRPRSSLEVRCHAYRTMHHYSLTCTHTLPCCLAGLLDGWLRARARRVLVLGGETHSPPRSPAHALVWPRRQTVLLPRQQRQALHPDLHRERERAWVHVSFAILSLTHHTHTHCMANVSVLTLPSTVSQVRSHGALPRKDGGRRDLRERVRRAASPSGRRRLGDAAANASAASDRGGGQHEGLHQEGGASPDRGHLPLRPRGQRPRKVVHRVCHGAVQVQPRRRDRRLHAVCHTARLELTCFHSTALLHCAYN